MTDIEQLIALYAKNSKHSNYQILSNKLSNIIDKKDITVFSRYEKERLEYILKNINITDKTILDIGGNSGFFSFEMIEAGAKHVLYYEGNNEHSEFVKLSAKILKVNDKVSIFSQYYSFNDELIDKVDITLLLNVLHHIGDDYGSKELALKNAKEEIIKQMNSFANKTSILVFQLGFNWKGNRNIGLFEKGTKEEMIEFVKQETQQNWEIIKIGVAQKKSGKIIYEDLDNKNIQRDDSLGEFLNRPLFILKPRTS